MLFFKKQEDLARIYQGMSGSEVKQINKAGIQEWFVKDAPIFRKGQVGKELYIIMDGAVRIVDDTVDPPKQIALLQQGELFGELSLTAKETRRSTKEESLRRSASALAAQDSTLFVVHEDAFRNLLDNNPDIASKLLMNLFYVTGERLREAIRGKVLAEGVPIPKLIRGLKDAEKKKLLKYSNVLHVPQGQPVFVEGQVGTEMYYVLGGSVAIMKKQEKGQKRLAVMGEGDVFGELGLITKKGRMASAVAISDSDVLAISEDGLMKLRKRAPDIATKVFLNLFRITTARMRTLISPLPV
ncbi:MAG: cyclic nucleotide-binding domain-containing protein [Candidatus Abyssobacteria bacterium SURF_5]|uniref:Cyclic nucleotide-binding domain-containing protein n=1 Tax=Abyssobacteria bacterium (strain SURF_5) TaxID=2093360 RepID=A0A3A4N623_ABYX5|nr:MAG: cyclic nucleotide-binding domain-containing protein [Candidatus Abyssubacteria bacterium SURF_5]